MDEVAEPDIYDITNRPKEIAIVCLSSVVVPLTMASHEDDFVIGLRIALRIQFRNLTCEELPISLTRWLAR